MTNFKCLPVIPGTTRRVWRNVPAPTHQYLSYPPSIFEVWKEAHHRASWMNCLHEHPVWAASLTNGQSARGLEKAGSPRQTSIGGNACLGGAR